MSMIQFNTRDIHETRTVREVGPVHYGGVLEWKRGTLCRRLADFVEMVRPNRWRITRRWRKPGPVPFNRYLYEVGESECSNPESSHALVWRQKRRGR